MAYIAFIIVVVGPSLYCFYGNYNALVNLMIIIVLSTIMLPVASVDYGRAINAYLILLPSLDITDGHFFFIHQIPFLKVKTNGWMYIMNRTNFNVFYIKLIAF